MTSGGLLINQSLVSLVTPNQYAAAAAAAAAGGFVANGPQPLALSVTVSKLHIPSVISDRKNII